MYFWCSLGHGPTAAALLHQFKSQYLPHWQAVWRKVISGDVSTGESINFCSTFDTQHYKTSFLVVWYLYRVNRRQVHSKYGWKVPKPGPLVDSLIRTRKYGYRDPLVTHLSVLESTDKWVNLGIGSTDSGTPVYFVRKDRVINLLAGNPVSEIVFRSRRTARYNRCGYQSWLTLRILLSSFLLQNIV